MSFSSFEISVLYPMNLVRSFAIRVRVRVTGRVMVTGRVNVTSRTQIRVRFNTPIENSRC